MRSFRFLFETGKTLLVALLIVIPLRLFVAQPFFVRGASMDPTFSNGDYLIIDELSYRFSLPKRGDVIVFRYPGDPSQFFIKRVIGLPGETISSAEGRVSVEHFGQRIILEESYLNVETTGMTPITAGPNEYVMLGDNRSASSDSRRWGVLPRENIIGRVFLIVWPPKDFSMFTTPVYQ